MNIPGDRSAGDPPELPARDRLPLLPKVVETNLTLTRRNAYAAVVDGQTVIVVRAGLPREARRLAIRQALAERRRFPELALVPAMAAAWLRHLPKTAHATAAVATSAGLAAMVWVAIPHAEFLHAPAPVPGGVPSMYAGQQASGGTHSGAAPSQPGGSSRAPGAPVQVHTARPAGTGHPQPGPSPSRTGSNPQPVPTITMPRPSPTTSSPSHSPSPRPSPTPTAKHKVCLKVEIILGIKVCVKWG